jgi:hypothetical protein
MTNTRLFHYAIGNMTDAYLPIYREISLGNGAIPYIVVSLAVTHKMTVMFEKKLTDFFLVFSH